MKKTLVQHRLLAGIVVLAVAIALPAAANAQNAHAQETQQNTETSQVATQQSLEERQTTSKQAATDHKAAAETKLADAKLKVCENRQKAITHIMARLADRGQKQLDLFSTIADRTESFYMSKGNTVANYDTLVADMFAQKSAAQSTVSTINSSSTTFDCNGVDPKGMVSSFRDSLKDEIAALKAYKTSVKNLIVGVKSAQGINTSTNSKSTGSN